MLDPLNARAWMMLYLALSASEVRNAGKSLRPSRNQHDHHEHGRHKSYFAQKDTSSFTEREVVSSSNAEMVCEFTATSIHGEYEHFDVSLTRVFLGPKFMDYPESALKSLLHMYSQRCLGRQSGALHAISGTLNRLA